MHLILLADIDFFGHNSGSILIQDLLKEFDKKKVQITAIFPSHSILKKTKVFSSDNSQIIIARSLNSKSHFYLFRTFAEIFNPFLMTLPFLFFSGHLKKADGVIWYSPSIFFGPIIRLIKYKKNIKSYLILRDIFPQWAIDLKILKINWIYHFFKYFEAMQYKYADSIGIQSQSNAMYFFKNYPAYKKKVEVLNNWMSKKTRLPTSINLQNTILKNRLILIYAGNFGKAQELPFFLKMARSLQLNKRIGFLLIGHGSEFTAIKKLSLAENYNNLLVMNSIPPKELESLYKQCDIGLISLDLRHTTHNTPGKFISYLLAGLPIAAIVNEGNDMINIINRNRLGIAISSKNLAVFTREVLKLTNELADNSLSKNCVEYARKNYLPSKAASQIIRSFK